MTIFSVKSTYFIFNNRVFMSILIAATFQHEVWIDDITKCQRQMMQNWQIKICK